MMNRKGTRLLITLILAAALIAVFGSEAFAAGRLASSSSHAVTVSKALKPGVSPMSGEPDTGGNAPPPKDGLYPTSGPRLSMWSARIQWVVRTLLASLPLRFPR